MAAKKKTDVEEVETVDVPASKTSKSAHVLSSEGKVINSYHEKDNADYKERADRLATKIGGSVKHE